MFRSFLLAAFLSTTGSVLFVAADAHACEGKDHAQRKDVDGGVVQLKAEGDEVKRDDAVAGKCSCSGASDCTCKKGDCQCPKCGNHKKRRTVVDPLKGASNPLQLPNTAQRDATAGAFI